MLPADVACPPIRVVHLGIGAFFRAFGLPRFEALNAALPRPQDRSAVMGVSLRSPAIRDALAPQDFTYHAIERGPNGDVPREITCLSDVGYAGEDRERIRGADDSEGSAPSACDVERIGERDRALEPAVALHVRLARHVEPAIVRVARAAAADDRVVDRVVEDVHRAEAPKHRKETRKSNYQNLKV